MFTWAPHSRLSLFTMRVQNGVPKFVILTAHILLLDLQIVAEQGPSLAPVTTKQVQFSELVDPQPTVTENV